MFILVAIVSMIMNGSPQEIELTSRTTYDTLAQCQDNTFKAEQDIRARLGETKATVKVTCKKAGE